MNKEHLQQLLKHLHHIFVPIGILFGFLLFATAAVVDPLAGFLAFVFIFLPAFFGGIYSGELRADDSDMLDVVTEMVNSIFKFDLSAAVITQARVNQICAITITLFYFAFWFILGISFDISVAGHFIKWILPSYLFGLLSNKDMLTPIISFAQKSFRKLKEVL